MADQDKFLEKADEFRQGLERLIADADAFVEAARRQLEASSIPQFQIDNDPREGLNLQQRLQLEAEAAAYVEAHIRAHREALPADSASVLTGHTPQPRRGRVHPRRLRALV